MEYSSCSTDRLLLSKRSKVRGQLTWRRSHLSRRVHQLKAVLLTVHRHRLRESWRRQKNLQSSATGSVPVHRQNLQSSAPGSGPLTVLDGGIVGVHELSLHKLDGERRLPCRQRQEQLNWEDWRPIMDGWGGSDGLRFGSGPDLQPSDPDGSAALSQIELHYPQCTAATPPSPGRFWVSVRLLILSPVLKVLVSLGSDLVLENPSAVQGSGVLCTYRFLFSRLSGTKDPSEFWTGSLTTPPPPGSEPILQNLFSRTHSEPLWVRRSEPQHQYRLNHLYCMEHGSGPVLVLDLFRFGIGSHCSGPVPDHSVPSRSISTTPAAAPDWLSAEFQFWVEPVLSSVQTPSAAWF